ncbi:hypothetical protein CLAIMM_08292 [Cladophialophora immunda]|nr:hypothetical protein CLAIMM_08292 [Cladophialophora immunda]
MDSPLIPFTEQLLRIGERSSKDSWLGMIIRKELVEINMLLPDFQPSGCLLTDMGEYLCHATDIIAQLAYRMTNGNHIHTYAQLNVNQMNSQTDLSELGLLDGMTAKHSTLKALAEKLECASKDICLAWQGRTAASHSASRSQKTFGKCTTRPIGVDTRPGIAPSSVAATFNPAARPSLRAQSPTAEATNHNETLPETTDSLDSVAERLLDEVNHRGKGMHHCPYGPACTKGGVSEDKSLVLFERNSAFKAHLEKHLKLHKCNLPGCSNKTGFSRLDMLHRHQTDVPHNAPAGLRNTD